MEEALWHICALGVLAVIESIRVQSLIGDDVVLEKSLEILFAVGAEQEGIDPGTEALESKVRGSKERSTDVVAGIVQRGKEAGLVESEFESAELARQQAENLSSLGRWHDDGVDAMNDTVGTKLKGQQENMN